MKRAFLLEDGGKVFCKCMVNGVWRDRLLGERAIGVCYTRPVQHGQ